MFGNHFKYVLALGFLATFVYTSPAVLDSISSGMAYNNQQAAIWDAWFGFGNHGQVPPEVRPNISSTTSSADFQRPPEQSFASSTRPVGNRDHKLNPQDVITILFKAGLISSDNLNQARQLFPQPPQAGSSTMGEGDRSMMVPPAFTGSTTPPMYGHMQQPPRYGDTVGSSTLQGIPIRARFAPTGNQQ